MSALDYSQMDDELANYLEQRLDKLLSAKRDGALGGEPEISRLMFLLSGHVPAGKPYGVLMAGMPGAGKTTLARALAQAGYTRLCPDEEMFRRYGQYGVDFPRGQFRVREEPVLRDVAVELRSTLLEGNDVVVDHGFWTSEDRNAWRDVIREAGGIPVLVYLPAPHEVRWSRIDARNPLADHDPNAISFSEEDLLRFAGRFFPPAADESHVIYDDDPAPIVAALSIKRRVR